MLSISLAVAIALQPVAVRTSDPGENLAWMAGDWHCAAYPPPRSGARIFEEYWVHNRDGSLVGVGRVRQHRTRSLEHMRIARDASGRLNFYGSPDGAAPVAFPLARAAANEAVFENPAHDYPQRIVYRHEPNRLIATISLIDGSRAQSWHYSNQTPQGERQVCSRDEGP